MSGKTIALESKLRKLKRISVKMEKKVDAGAAWAARVTGEPSCGRRLVP